MKSEGFHLAVCLKVTPKMDEVTFDEENGALNRAGARGEINPADKHAVEMALQFVEQYGGKVSLVSMGPPFITDELHLAMAMGAERCILLSDRAFALADTYPTARTLAAGVTHLADVDMVLCGDESSDSSTGQVPPGVAEWLGWEQATYVEKLELAEDGQLHAWRGGDGVPEIVSLPLPAVVSVENGAAPPRFPDFARKAELDEANPVEILTIDDVPMTPDEVGLPGSWTEVAKMVSLASPERDAEMIVVDDEESLNRAVEALYQRLT